jgi:Xaa-Pro aminopeptidase
MTASLTKPYANTVSELDYSLDNLDALMEKAGIDVLLATSKHNVRYLLGGYEFIFFSAMDAIGHSRYLPVVIYIRGRPDDAAFVGNKMEGAEHKNNPFWVPHVKPLSWGTSEAIDGTVAHLKSFGLDTARIGVEPGFLPMDAAKQLATDLPSAKFVDAVAVLERLRMIKSNRELDLLKTASERISEAMQETMQTAGPGDTKTSIIERLRRAETMRDLQFDYCLITLGASHNRAASSQVWQTGEIISLDSGGNLHGYIGDICRMGILGEPDAELRDLLAEVEETQQAAFSKVAPGATGGDMIAHASKVKSGQPNAACTDFFAHGMGLVSHEAPFLMTNHPVTYDGIDADTPLQPGMVLSVETTMLHPTRGFIKLEDTVVVRSTGYELFGTEGRGWTVSGC